MFLARFDIWLFIAERQKSSNFQSFFGSVHIFARLSHVLKTKVGRL